MFRYDHLLIVAVVGLFFSTTLADTIHVDDDNCPGPGSGTEGDPYCSIQTAIDNAADTDEIVVASGTYYETIDFLGKAVWLHSSDGAGVTIIDAQTAGTVVTCDSGEGPDTVLEITGGSSGGPFGFGGGMYITSSNPTVTGCTFYENTATIFGAGIYISDSSPTVTQCSFVNNHATVWCGPFGCGEGRGGGICNVGFSNPTVTDCTFSGNTAQGGGGGMFNIASSPTLTNCTFDGNTASSPVWGGGGMYNGGGSPTVTDCKFTNNGAAIGGGMANNSLSTPTVTDCTFSGNSAGEGGGVYNYNSSPTVTDCTFSGNGAFFGGGMANWSYSNPTVTDCRFSANEADSDGGGMFNDQSSPTITDSRFCENTPDHIWGPWDGDDNTFLMFCRRFGFDKIDVGVDDVLNLLDH
jgi:hypothetical protein